MNINNETVFSWVNGWSMTITPSWNCFKVSVMGPRQVFYSVSKDLKHVQPSADEAVDFMNTTGLTKLMLMMERMPARVMIEPFAAEEAVIVDEMCKRCGGHIKNTCEDCSYIPKPKGPMTQEEFFELAKQKQDDADAVQEIYNDMQS